MLDLQILWIISLISCSFNSRLPSLESLAFPPCYFQAPSLPSLFLRGLVLLSHLALAPSKVLGDEIMVDMMVLWGVVSCGRWARAGAWGEWKGHALLPLRLRFPLLLSLQVELMCCWQQGRHKWLCCLLAWLTCHVTMSFGWLLLSSFRWFNF